MAATTTLSGHRPLSNLSPLRTLGSAGAVNLFLCPLLLQFRSAVRAAGGVVGDDFFAVGALSWFLGRCFREEAVNLFYHDEDGEGHDEEVDDVVQELAVGNNGDSHFLGFRNGGDRHTGQGEEKVGEVDASQNVSQRRHDDVADQGGNDLSESGPDDNAHCHVYHIAAKSKILEFFEHTHEIEAPFS